MAMQPITVTVMLLCALGCGTQPARPQSLPQPSAAPELDISTIPPRATVMLGDLHGTREIPAFVGRFARALAAREPAVIALEITKDNAPSIDAFLASDGGTAARQQLLATPWWQSPYQDGRRSVAMLDLLDTLRALRHAGQPLEVVLIDSLGTDRESREAAMADNVLAARRARPDATLVVYAGNLHTSIGEVPFAPGFPWMAMRVAKAGITVVSLNARYADGTAWICTGGAESCGVALSPGRGGELGIRREPQSGRGAYDGWFGVGPITASPPAGRPDLARDFATQIAQAAHSPQAVALEASRLYEAKRYADCADKFATIAKPDAGIAYDHACCLALAGRKDEALSALQRALDAGFTDLAHARDDADLASLRDDPRWPIKN